jgi:hypothetical protein
VRPGDGPRSWAGHRSQGTKETGLRTMSLELSNSINSPSPRIDAERFSTAAADGASLGQQPLRIFTP